MLDSLGDLQDSLTPMSFAESMYLMNGQPLRFGTGRRYLRPIHNADIPEMILMTGRQVEKTTTASVKIGNEVLLQPFSRSLYVAPLNEQVKVFSQTRLDKLFRYSVNDLVRRRYMSNKLANQVYQKEYTNGSEVFLRNCYEEADNIRGLSIDTISIDEIQDIYMPAIPVILETQARSKKPKRFYTGTPKTFSNTIQQLWDDSSQAEWVIRCPGCGKRQVLGQDSLSPESYLCRFQKCRKPLDDITRANGIWVHRFPEKKRKGFRITQMMIPDMKSEAVYNKAMEYPAGKFHNEVIGHSYENAEKPFSDASLNRAIQPNEIVYEQVRGVANPFASAKTYIGIDWGEGEKVDDKGGTGYTVVVVLGETKDGRLQMLNAKRFIRGEELDPDYQVDWILRWNAQYKPTKIIADYGGGMKENMRLHKRLGGKFVQCHYVGNQSKTIVHHPNRNEYTVQRSEIMTDFIIDFDNVEIIIPGRDYEDINDLRKNFKGVYSEYRSSSTGASERLFYGHPLSQPDDYVHAFIYAWLWRYIIKSTNVRSANRKNSGFKGTSGR